MREDGGQVHRAVTTTSSMCLRGAVTAGAATSMLAPRGKGQGARGASACRPEPLNQSQRGAGLLPVGTAHPGDGAAGTRHLQPSFLGVCGSRCTHRARGVHRQWAGGRQTPGRGPEFSAQPWGHGCWRGPPGRQPGRRWRHSLSEADVKASAVLLGSQGDLVFRGAELRVGTCNFFQI